MATDQTRIAVAGASGKMGQALIQAIASEAGCRLHAALDRDGSPLAGQDAGQRLGLDTGILVTSRLDALQGADVLIDFTRPEASLLHMKACTLHGVGLVLGTTGFDTAGRDAIDEFGQRNRLVFAPNMSLGVNITFKILEVAARLLQKGYDIEITEAHHRQKVDAPSGTALRMGEVVALASGRAWPQDAVLSREGHTGARTDAEIGFSVIRGGDIVGDHTVMFAGQGERIEISHRSSSRAGYAQGALRAAKFLHHQPAGQYDMQDVLGLAAKGQASEL